VLGIELQKIDTIVLSHGHLDHTGGLRRVLREIGKEVKVVAHPEVWSDKYFKLAGKPERFINIPFQPQELERLGARFELTDEPYKLSESIFTTGEIPLINNFETVQPPQNSERYIKQGNRQVADVIGDDLALIIDSADGLLVVLGCAHRGIINTLCRAQEVTGKQKIHAVLGGAHLHDATEDRIRFVIESLKNLGVEMIALNHCTGQGVACRLQQEFGDRFHFNPAGTSIEFDM
jgi:7,8-dihydropterin-6-yl-methyl-4-(beta-D-ribofuranosyl)aminobenzene 5'-phosphate synthase